MHFKTMVQSDVPQGRDGKHKLIVTTILNDLDRLKGDSALKVPLDELAQAKEKVRSALNRATRKAGRKVATASDGTFLYVERERVAGTSGRAAGGWDWAGCEQYASTAKELSPVLALGAKRPKPLIVRSFPQRIRSQGRPQGAA
jgi:hypothetical protein